MANLPKGFVPDDEQPALPEGFVPDDPDEAPPSWLDPVKFRAEREAERKKYRESSQLGDLAGATVFQPNVGEGISAPILSAIDRYSGGLLRSGLRLDQQVAGNPIARAVDAIPLIGPIIGKRGGQTAARTLATIDDYRATNPVASQYTDIPGYVAPGGIPSQMAQGFAGAAKKALPGFAGTLGAAAATGETLSGLEAMAEGEGDPMSILERAASGGGAATALVPGMVGAGKLIGAAGRAVQRSKGGQAREFLESHGETVGPRMSGMGASDAEIGLQSELSAKRGLQMLNEEKKGVLGGIGRKIGRVEGSPEAAELQVVDDMIANMRAATQELDTSPQARGALNDLIASVEAKQGQGFNPDVDSYMLSLSDVNKLRRSLDRYAKTGVSTDASLSPLKSAANEARGMVNEGPFAEPNADYARESKFFQDSRRLLGINERPKSPQETKAAEEKVINLIGRRGQNTVTAGKHKRQLAEFAERHPDIGEEFAQPEIMRNKADISFRLLPQRHGGLIDRTGSAIGGAAALEGLMHMLSHGHVDPAKVAAAGALGLTMQNLPAIQARLLYPAALEAQAAAPLLLGEVPLMSVARGANEPRRKERR